MPSNFDRPGGQRHPDAPSSYLIDAGGAIIDVRNPFALDNHAPEPQLQLPADIERLVERARIEELERKGAGAASTRRAYLADWTVFLTWCDSRAFCPLPAEPLTIARYMRYLIDRDEETVLDHYTINGMDVARKRKIKKAHSSTVARHIVSIRKAHVTAGLPDPTDDVNVKRVWKGICAERGRKPKQQKVAVKADMLLQAVRALDTIHRDAEAKASGGGLVRAERAAQLLRLRDRALLLCGWSGAFRRSEIAAIDLEHLHRDPEGLRIELPFSKTNQSGEEEYVLISRGSDPDYCGARALETWLAATDLKTGAIFRHVDRHGNIHGRISPVVVADVMKRAAIAINLDPKTIGAHSLRAGWITTAAVAGRKEEAIMRHSRHKSIPIMRSYIRTARKWNDHAGDGLL